LTFNVAFYLFPPGLVSGFTEVNRIYSIDLYDTTMDDQDIRISDELIKSQLMWPDMSVSKADDAEDQGKYVKQKVQSIYYITAVMIINGLNLGVSCHNEAEYMHDPPGECSPEKRLLGMFCFHGAGNFSAHL